VTGRRSSPAAIVGLVAVAAILGGWGLGFGLPFDFRPDEELFTGRAVQMAVQHTLDPHFYIYPPLGLYLFALAEWLLGVVAPAQLGAATQVDPSAEYLATRLVSVLALAATTGLVGLAGRAAYGALAGSIAAATFAVAPLAVQNAHFGRIDIVALAFMALAMWAGGRADSRTGWAVAGVAAGLAAGTKYTVGVVIVYLVVLLLHGSDRRARFLALAAGAVIAFVAVFLPAGHPLQFVDGFRYLAGRSAQGYGLPIGFLYHPTVSLPAGLGLAAYALSLAGIVVALWRRSPTDRALLALLAAYLLLVGFSEEVFLRYALPLLLPLCLLAGGVARLAEAGKLPAAAVAGLAALLLAPSALASIQGDRLLTTTDTRVEAAFWLLANAAPGTELVVPNYWGEPFYDAAAIQARPLHPLYLAGDALPDSYQLGRFSDRFVINRAVGTHCYQVYESGPPWQSPPPSVPAGATVAARFTPYRGAPPGGAVYDPLDSFYLPLAGFGSIERPGPSIVITVGCTAGG
jgi:4-amino-4-deoxy-L-arabinose transferase-like glycosyltransferase